MGKVGVVDVGGGERGAYGAGVLDRCLEAGIDFDNCIGVSAGAANLVSYIAGQLGRNFAFYTHYSFRPQYMGILPLLRKRQYVDLDYVYGELSDSKGEYPLDYRSVEGSPKEFTIVATDAESGLPVYFTKDALGFDDYSAIKASSALPLVSKPYPVDGRPCFDGGLSDPIPLRRAFDEGCERVVLILTRPKDAPRNPGHDRKVARMIAGRYPRIAEALTNRAGLYNLQLDLARRYEREGRVLIVAPDDIGAMKTLTKDSALIEQLYGKGYADGGAIESFLG